MIHRPIPGWLYYLLGIAGVMVVACVYAALSTRQTHINPDQSVMPGFSALGEGVVEIFKSRGNERNPRPSWISNDASATYWRLALGLASGVALSVVVGVSMGAYTAAEAFFNPLITFFAKIPPTAMLAVYMVVFGMALKMYVAMVAFGVFFTMAQAIYQSVRKDVSTDLIDKAYTLGASEIEVLYEVVWRQVLPRVIENLRLQIGPAMVFLIAAEWAFADQGFGYTLRQQSKLLNMNVVYLYLAILGLTGLGFDWALMRLRRWLCPWFGE
ncbi:MAG: ABC transporter permease subunit [Planctomycetales bacterium]|nr:ABC transporter permease subunit [Planctomycetales bacterium]